MKKYMVLVATKYNSNLLLVESDLTREEAETLANELYENDYFEVYENDFEPVEFVQIYEYTNKWTV